MSAIHDPRVQYAIRMRCERRARQRQREAVVAALEQEGAATLAELVEITGIGARECGRALDELRVQGRAVAEQGGLFRWAGDSEKEGRESDGNSDTAGSGGSGDGD